MTVVLLNAKKTVWLKKIENIQRNIFFSYFPRSYTMDNGTVSGCFVNSRSMLTEDKSKLFMENGIKNKAIEIQSNFSALPCPAENKTKIHHTYQIAYTCQVSPSIVTKINERPSQSGMSQNKMNLTQKPLSIVYRKITPISMRFMKNFPSSSKKKLNSQFILFFLKMLSRLRCWNSIIFLFCEIRFRRAREENLFT